MRKYLLALLLLAGAAWASPAAAQSSTRPCFYNAAGVCVFISADNPLPVTASVSASISGFAPATTGTPISVTTGGVSGTLPAGAVVVASNVGATNGAYCKLGASATTSDQLIPPNSWFAFTVGIATQLTCITSTSTTTVNMVGGAGLPTGSGGGGGGGSSSNASVSATGAAVPASATYLGISIGGNIVGVLGGAGTEAGAMRVTLPTDGTGLVKANPGTASNWGVGATGAAVPANAMYAGFLSGANLAGASVGTVSNVASAATFLNVLGVGRYNTAPPTITDTQFNALQVGSRGATWIQIMSPDSTTPVASATTAGTGATLSGTGLRVLSPNYVSNGTTLDIALSGAGAVAPGVQRVTQASDSPEITALGAVADSAWSGSGSGAVIPILKYIGAQVAGALPAGTATIGGVIIRQTANSTDGVVAGGALGQTTALATGLVVKASAGVLTKFQVTTTTVSGFVLVFNSATVPAAGGSKTPIKCYQAPANSTIGDSWLPGAYFATGISISFSASTSCFTQTDSATAFISAEAT